ncbi:LegC family aminotransferase [Spirochaetota bacterium]
MDKYEHIAGFIKSLYPDMNPVLLHCPQFLGKEKEYLNECIDTKYVSYVGRFVVAMEDKIREITGAKYAVAMVNGTEALRMALLAAGVAAGDEVITQALTFAATCAAIVHSLALPVFIDVDKETLGMSPEKLRFFLKNNTKQVNGACINKSSGKRIKAVVPMHTFGHPCKIDEIKAICSEHNILLIEDSAESLGSYYKGKHTGTFGDAGIFSFNGNKPVTTGGGGMLISNDEKIADRARYLSTTAKKPHAWEFVHTEAGYNLRMPSLNAAIGYAQLEYFDKIITSKLETAQKYHDFFSEIGINTFREPENSKSNYWLNALVLDDKKQRDAFLEYTNNNGIQTRPIWTLMHKLPPYSVYEHDDLTVSEYYEERLVNIPSSVRPD